MDLDKLLHERWTNPARTAYSSVEGYILPKKYQESKEEFDNFPVRNEDIWVCTFPKTGTTWTQEMVWLIVNNLDFEKAKDNLDSRSPFLEFSVIMDPTERLNTDPNYKPAEFRADSINYTKKQNNIRVIKTHLPFELLPNEIKNGTKSPKIVYVAREPKDTCVSYYHHSRNLERFTGNFDEFVELFVGDKVSYGPFWRHVFSFWKIRNIPNVLFLRYEEMKKDLSGVIKKVAAFLERDLTNEQVEVLSKHLSFDSMKKNPSVNREARLKNSGGKFMRSGRVGDYKNLMSEEQIRRFEEWIKKNVEGTDYVFL